MLEDDLFGLKVFETVFQGRQEIDAGFEQVRNRIVELAEKDVIELKFLVLLPFSCSKTG